MQMMTMLLPRLLLLKMMVMMMMMLMLTAMTLDHTITVRIIGRSFACLSDLDSLLYPFHSILSVDRRHNLVFGFQISHFTHFPINWPIRPSRQTLPSMLMLHRAFSSRRSLLDIAPRNLFAKTLTGIHGFASDIYLKNKTKYYHFDVFDVRSKTKSVVF